MESVMSFVKSLGVVPTPYLWGEENRDPVRKVTKSHICIGPRRREIYRYKFLNHPIQSSGTLLYYSLSRLLL